MLAHTSCVDRLVVHGSFLQEYYQKKKYAKRKLNKQRAATICTGTPSAGCCWMPIPVVPVVIRSLESWLTASVFLCFRTCSSPWVLRPESVPLAWSSCVCSSSPDFGAALDIPAATEPSADFMFEATELAFSFTSEGSLYSESREPPWDVAPP